MESKIKELEQKISSDRVVKKLNELWGSNCDSLYLTGGAVIDILEGRFPKDYDFHYTGGFNVGSIINQGLKMGLTFNYTSATSVSFILYGVKIQVLRNTPKDFPFTIEQSKFSLKKLELEYFDELSFIKKILIPNDTAYIEGVISESCYNSRIRKWESKGYSIHKITRCSYRGLTTRRSFLRRILNVFFNSESKES